MVSCRRLWWLSASLATIALWPGVISASIVIPSGLLPGQQYRVAFVTSGTHDALSSDIDVYNQFVNAQADLAGIGPGAGIQWHAIASTPSTSAYANLYPTGVDTIPIYTSLGVLIATGAADLFDGALLAQLLHSQSGAEVSNAVWTGSNNAGTQSAALGNTGDYAMTANPGSPSWLMNLLQPKSSLYSLYALSDPITVSTGSGDTPEPTALAIWSLLGLCGAGVGWRRRNAQRGA